MSHARISRLTGLYKILLVLTICYVTGAVIYKTGVLQQFIQEQVEQALSKAFRREIKAESLSGSLFTQLLLSNVKIASDGRIEDGVFLELKELNARIDILKMLSRGDFLAGIDVVNLVDGVMIVERIKGDKWNLLDFAIPPKKEGVKRSKNKFRGRLYLKNISGQFTDDKGWGIAPLDEPFIEPFTDLSGYMDFSEFDEVPMQFTAKVQSSKTPVSINGLVDAYHGNFDLYLNISSLDADKWGPYIIPVKSVRISQDRLDIRGTLRRLEQDQGEMTFSLITSFQDLQFELPKLTYPIRNLSGEFEFTNKGGKQVRFKDMVGQIHQNPIRAKGTVHIEKKQYDVDIDLAKAAFKSYLQNFPFINQNIDYLGSAKGQLNLSGPLTKPVFKGRFTLENVGLHRLSIPKEELDIKLKDDTFSFWDADQERINGLIDFKPTSPKIQAEFNLRNVDLDAKVENLDFIFELRPIDLKLSIDGDTKQLAISGQALTPDTVVLGQNLSQISFEGRLEDMSQIILPSLRIQSLNGLDLQGHLNLFPNKHYDYDFSQDLKKSKSSVGITARIQGDGSLDPKNRLSLFAHNAELSYTQEGGRIAKQEIESIRTELSLNSKQLTIKDLSFQKNDKELRLRLAYDKKKSGDIHLDLKQINADPLVKWLDPDLFGPEDSIGRLDGSVAIDYEQWDSLKTRPKTMNGRLDLELSASVILQQPIDSVHLKASFSNSKIEGQSLEIVRRKSQIKSSFDVLKGEYWRFNLHDGTIVKMSDVSALYNPFLEWESSILLNGEVRYTYQDNSIESSLDVSALDLITPFTNIDTISARFDLKDRDLIVTNGLIQQEGSQINASLRLRGLIAEDKIQFNSLDQITYQLSTELSNVSMASTYQQWLMWKTLNNRQAESEPWQQLQSKVIIQDESRLLFHRLENAELDLFTVDAKKWTEKLVSESKKKGVTAKGVMNGRVAIQKGANPYVDVTADLTVTSLDIAKMTAEEARFSIRSDQALVNVATEATELSFRKKPIKQLEATGAYDRKQGLLSLTQLSALVQQKKQDNLLKATVPIRCLISKNCNDDAIWAQLMIPAEAKDLWSIFAPEGYQLENSGALTLTLAGPVQRPVIKGSAELRDFHLTNVETGTADQISIKSAKITAENNRIFLPKTKIRIRYQDSITEPPSVSHLWLSSEMTVTKLDLLERQLHLMTSTGFKASALDIDLSSFQNAKITDLDLQLKGPLVFPVSNTSPELPILSGHATIEEADLRVKSNNNPKIPNMALNINLSIEPNVVISGALIGGGGFTFANNFYFETERSKIQITGTSQKPLMREGLRIKEGAISLFDSYYELLKEEDQRYFQLASNIERQANELYLRSILVGGEPKVVPVLHITAVNYIPVSRLENESEALNQTGYQTVMVRINGPLSNLEESLDLAVFSMSSTYPKNAQIELQQYFTQPLMQSSNEREQSDAISYITPTALKSSNSDSVETIGEQQTNVLFRKTISPIERRIAKKTGLYDLKVDYNLGRSLRNRLSDSSDAEQEENLLGVNFIWGLLSDRLLLRLKTDIDTNSQTQSSGQLKLTEFELTYLFTQQLSANLTHVSEYQELSEFEPLLSISFLQRF